MPKSKNPLITDNQQGEHLSYVVGVYFGDGYVGLNHGGVDAKFFRLITIDEDFRDHTLYCASRAFQEHTATPFKYIVKKTGKLFFGVQVRGIGNYLESITGKKRFVPNFIYKSDGNKKAFIEGLIDSEGWIQLQANKSGNVFRGHIGFAITSEVIHELTKILAQVGVKFGKVGTYTKNRNRPLKHISLNIPSFIDAGLKFNIKRKQDKVDKFKLIRSLIGGTKTERCTFRDSNPGLIERMVESDLCGDAKRLAEMSSPV